MLSRRTFLKRDITIGWLACLLATVTIGNDIFAAEQNGVTPRTKYSLGELRLGKAHFTERELRNYKCEPSELWPQLARCIRERRDRERRGSFTVTEALLVGDASGLTYANRFINPAYWSGNEVEGDINRLTKKFNEAPTIQRMPHRIGLPDAVIATWGGITLEPLTSENREVLARGGSPGVGILVDYLGDFTQSVQQGLPVYRIGGSAGAVWIGSFDGRGRGSLRYLVADASAMDEPVDASSALGIVETPNPVSGGQATAEIPNNVPPVSVPSAPVENVGFIRDGGLLFLSLTIALFFGVALLCAYGVAQSRNAYHVSPVAVAQKVSSSSTASIPISAARGGVASTGQRSEKVNSREGRDPREIENASGEFSSGPIAATPTLEDAEKREIAPFSPSLAERDCSADEGLGQSRQRAPIDDKGSSKPEGIISDGSTSVHKIGTDTDNRQFNESPLDPIGAVRHALSEYGTVDGRASRSEYWYFFLFAVFGSALAAFLDAVFKTEWKTILDGQQVAYSGHLQFLWTLAITVPFVTLTTRRLHDVGKSGWWQLLWLVPIVGWGILVYWHCCAGPRSDNEYGQEPRYSDRGAAPSRDVRTPGEAPIVGKETSSHAVGDAGEVQGASSKRNDKAATASVLSDRAYGQGGNDDHAYKEAGSQKKAVPRSIIGVSHHLRRIAVACAVVGIAAVAYVASSAKSAPKCGDGEVVELVLNHHFEQASITVEDDKVSFLFGGQIDRATFDDVVSASIEFVRERDYKPETMKRYCTGEVVIEVDGEKFQGLDVHKTEKGAWVGITTLASSGGSKNYSVQITEDGSTFVTVDE